MGKLASPFTSEKEIPTYKYAFSTISGIAVVVPIDYDLIDYSYQYHIKMISGTMIASHEIRYRLFKNVTQAYIFLNEMEQKTILKLEQLIAETKK